MSNATRCTSCGDVLDSIAYEDANGIYCWQCEPDTPCREVRICDECGQVMHEGFCGSDGAVHLCEECFEPWMDASCPDGWRVNEHEDDRLWDGGYYDELIDGEWLDTGIYWTQWD